jgi:hypothetical protein
MATLQTVRGYANGAKRFVSGDIDWDAHTIKAALVSSAYTPSQAHEFYSTSVNANEITGTGYTDGGLALTSKATAVIDASAATARAASTAYQVGDIVRPATANGRIYKCVVAGTSSSGTPSYTLTGGREVADGTVVWVEAGVAYVRFTCAQLSWDPSTITARYVVLYRDATAGSLDFLIGYGDFGQNESSSAGAFTIQFPADGVFRQLIAT